MGTPIKKTIGLNYANSDTYFAYPESAVITLYTDLEKKKTTAKLIDENLNNFIKSIIDSGIIPDKKLNGFLNSFNLGETLFLQSSTTCVVNDVFSEEEGKKRATAKVLVRRDICVNTLLDLVEDEVHKKFSNTKKRFILKMNCLEYYMDYYDSYANRKHLKEKKIISVHKELINILKERTLSNAQRIKKLEENFFIRIILKWIKK